MSTNKVNSLIMQNRLLTQARSRARSQSAARGSVLLGSSSNSKDGVLNSIKNQALSNTNKQSESDLKSKENYTTMKEAAESIQKRVKNLLSWPERDLDKMTEDEIAEYKVDVRKEVTSFVEDYNKMIKSMAAEDSKVNETYLKQMKGYFENAKAELEKVGITQGEDGKLSINQELLKEADADTLKKVFGSEGTFVDDIGKKAEKIIDNADTNLAIIKKSLYAGNYSYNQYGNDIFEMLAGGIYNNKG